MKTGATKFLAALKKLNTFQYCPQFQASTGAPGTYPSEDKQGLLLYCLMGRELQFYKMKAIMEIDR